MGLYNMSTRLGEIKNWISGLFPNIDLSSLHYIQADASDRKYLRFNLTELSFIIMDSKPDAEFNNFINIAQLLSQHGLTVPKIIEVNTEQGLILMNDLGAQTYLSILKEANLATAHKLYSDAISALIKMQLIANQNNAYQLPNMDSEYINNRLNVFNTWYLQHHLHLEPSNAMLPMLTNLQKMFNSVFQNQQQVFVHLDYHSRNLMYLTSNSNPGILDFQDAMWGPITYDLVSLLQDAYITWPRAQVEIWVSLYVDMAVDAGLMVRQDSQQVLRNFDLVGLQRHIKNLGIFARLHYRDKKSSYLQDIPALLHYIVAACHRYPELSALHEFLKEHILEVSL